MMISIIAGFMLASTDAFPEKGGFSNKEAVFENYEGGISKSEAIQRVKDNGEEFIAYLVIYSVKKQKSVFHLLQNQKSFIRSPSSQRAILLERF